MRLPGIIISLLFIFSPAVAQVAPSVVPVHKLKIDSLKSKLALATTDSARISLLQLLNFNYETENVDSSIKYGMEALALCRRIGNRRSEARTLSGLSGIYGQQGRYAEALDVLFQARKLAQSENFTFEIARSYRRAGAIYFEIEDYQRSLESNLIALRLDQTLPKNGGTLMIDDWIVADAYCGLGMLDSAFKYARLSLAGRRFNENLVQSSFRVMGNVFVKMARYDSALVYFREGLRIALKNVDFHLGAQHAIGMANIYARSGETDSVKYYAGLGFDFSERIAYRRGMMTAANILSHLYDSSDPARALKYSRIESAARDSLFGVGSSRIIQSLISREEEQKKEADASVVAYRNRVRLYALIAGLFVLTILAYILFRNNRRQRKANKLLHRQKEELSQALGLVKATQVQLIQSEKMASLGQLTAGIAHEIQNPLNFVTNFSDLNTELVAEMKEALRAGNREEAVSIAETIAGNEQKINQHGKRAGSIVKSMLQHSRTSTGKKELTDVNALITEYLTLAFHGIRAKNKDFTAELVTSLDDSIGEIHLISQDIGRVFFNLINNAFYAVNQKRMQKVPGYKPLVSVATKKIADGAEIRIRDNGTGIPRTVTDKIFQPFFTTKPAGEGTGLGLSLSYDIIKAHGGELKVDTQEDAYTEFIVSLPG